MKKLAASLAVAALLFSVGTFAQEVKKETKAKKAKTEKNCTVEEKKACSTEKKSCCAAKAEKKA
ncbi:hypothetical protein [Flavobacterium sp. H122]|uniref:hypothetical protein n=1 Tax=Flavobacterium sp. H122 TaxID=2529860 RepID=UPI0010AA0530|nr:hypothetical protein [Flavobacterium sp. H122]